MPEVSFEELVHHMLLPVPTGERLADSYAVVLERLARGAGTTRWFYCTDDQSIKALAAQLSPGSVVSFYFDRRIADAPFSAETKTALRECVRNAGELLVGTLRIDGLQIDMEILSGENELNDFLSAMKLGMRIFFGTFPARDNDGVAALTLTLPDRDGIVRTHPH